ncbi:MAG: ribosome-associated translation inhibitor RaiA [Vicinamibacteria bacterium]
MKIEFTGRQTEVPRALQTLAERKLAKLQKVLHGITRVHAVLAVDKHRETAELEVHSRSLDLLATETTRDLGTSLARAFDKLTRQAQSRTGRRRDGKRRAAPLLPRPPAEPEPAPAEERVKVFRSRRAAPKPLSMEEAVLEMQGREGAPLVFRDSLKGALKVLYRRGDGHLGLIEPEL